MAIPPFRKDGWLPIGHHAATLDEAIETLGGVHGSRRRRVTERLLWLCEGLVRCGVRGYLVLNGSYVSAKEEPGDFDVLLVAEPGVDALKAGKPSLAEMLDPTVSPDRGYDVFYTETVSPVLDLLRTMWDEDTRKGVAKGVLEVPL